MNIDVPEGKDPIGYVVGRRGASWGVAGRGGVMTDREFDTWRTWLEDVGQIKKGEVKAADLYTNRFNPYRRGGSGR